MRTRLWSARHAKPMDAGMWPGCWISLIPTWSGLISILRSRILSPRRVTAGSSSGGRWNVRLSGAWRRRSRKSWRFLFSGPARVRLLHADPHPGNFRLLPDGRLGVLDFGAVSRLPDGFPPVFGRVLRLMHEGGDPAKLEEEFRSHGYLRDGVSVDLTALRALLAPLAEPSKAESFRFSREWLRTETAQTSALRSSSILRRLNL